MRRTSRNSFNFDFSLRRLLLQGARAARGSPPLGQRLCDVEKASGSSRDGGGPSGSSSKHDKGSGSSHSGSHKHNLDSTSQHSANSPGNLDRGTSTSKLTPNSHKSSNSLHSKSTAGSGSGAASGTTTHKSPEECPLCYDNLPAGDEFFALLNCKHYACRGCLENYLMIEISESRTDISCPQCPESMHPTDIQTLLKAFPAAITKYEDFMVRRVLLADPDSRWCPGPDCSYAVVASGCASCPRIRCERPGCDVQFCYHCKAEWHPDQTCDAARASRQSPTRAPSGSISHGSHHKDDIKPCPRCQVLIVKMDDGSCNHMVCAICGSEFCWLCMKEISDLHYLSPSGCTFWGKKPWSRKKKLLWQLGTLVGAPLGIALVAGIAVPAMIIGIPVWVGRKIHTRYKLAGKHKRNLAVLGGVTASVIVSPVLAGLAVAIGVPILLFYVYGVVPVSLCRAGCGEGTKFEFDEEEDNGSRNHDATSVDAVSRIGATSIGEVSLSVASGSHLGVSSQHSNFGVVTNPSTRESTTALAGSITGHRLEVQADISTSETASAVTCVSEKSGNTLNDTASTKALAGSILSYRAQQMATDSACFSASEDGASERVRFDNTVCYVIDGGSMGSGANKKEYCDIWYTVPLDQDTAADKASLGSSRSFRSSERSFRDDFDSTSLSSSHNTGNITTSGSHHSHGGAIGTNPSGGSGTSLASSTKHPRMNTFGQRIPKLGSAALQHRTLSIDSNTGSYNIPENVSLEQELEEQDQQEQQSLSSLTQSPKVTVSPVTTTTDKSTSPSRTMADEPPKSRTHILRNLFFAQTGSGTTGSRDNSLGSSPKS
ncbi:E3 ubiquitin-protein ligase RNF19B isoform X1 [Aedes aegypti]|uniref:RBR-type E3 ubiquitin transferase n=1 Tax=Aedes aegypti TaxID=7159 RepID=A0A6I8TEU8_AEDAE|nr:E3 ubiquitin-protein ligase RNF19B isoform X1 [Aedes aegypti]XP_021693519.1 E3 ubiquitin-protein ligase RNF19B isoform X1 [Aedes aegypti]XP_021693520.1 E3 ubiquitin-protein ligase RNF19B isoform X1 [Aedes aegypti]XP_021693521.1 E3 ubiquitin-protein ligase RNF19B isoform X1 [Aedes aegypti]XP_021693522.1 E3 ubiquitin-protein ligase RNF19B isoform X1 [Aedes aegypti]XP_021693523.1 E3 ubiquitin-protein ligase RNF19B isoform X1 [Aedes aegypti]